MSRPDAANKPCEYRVTAKAAAAAGDATFTIPYTSSSGATLDAQVTVKISNIAFTAPSLSMAAGETKTFSVGSYAADSTFAITCSDATGVSIMFDSVTRTPGTCDYSVKAYRLADAGAASFTVTYRSSGGDTQDGEISITITTISYTAPNNLKVAAGSSTDITASGWAAHTGYTITCGNAKSIDSKLSSVTRPDAANKPCEYRITAKANSKAAATFTIPYTSSAGATLDAQVEILISNIQFTAPNLFLAAGSISTISANAYATDDRFTITCSDATSISSKFTSVTRTANTCKYEVTIKATSTGAASFTIRYTSSGGDTHDATISITITALAYSAPSDLKIAAGTSLNITANYATHRGYTVTCGEAKDIHAKLSSVTRPDAVNKSCEYRITAKATAATGDATFTIPYTSSSGATLDAQVTIKISNITYNAPSLSMVAGETLSVPAGSYVSDGTFTISCADATSVSAQFTSVTLTANTCDYSVIAKPSAAAGAASFTIRYTSTGGDTHDATISIAVSGIIFSPPADLIVAAGQTLEVNVASYAVHTGFSISCSDAIDVDSKIASITRAACLFDVTAGEEVGDASFTVPYVSSSGSSSMNAVFALAITPSVQFQPEESQDDPSTQTATAALPSFSLPFVPATQSLNTDTLMWNFFTVRQGGTSTTEIMIQLAAPAYPNIWAWSPKTQIWTRIPSSTTTLPQGTMIAFRVSQMPTPDALATLNLGATENLTAVHGWNIISSPADLSRSDSRSFLFADGYLNCDNRMHTLIVATYDIQTGTWHLWLPCHPESEALHFSQPNAVYNELARISQYQPIYFCLQTPEYMDIAWNPAEQRYETQASRTLTDPASNYPCQFRWN